MISRLLELPQKRSFFVFGPRQTGKSTLIRSSFAASKIRVYDFLKTDEYHRILAQPEIFREEVQSRPSQITHILVDEVQRIPDVLNEVHCLLESPNSPHFILSGSSARKLKRANANLLGGRAWTLKLFPLTHLELGQLFQLTKALEFGTLPSIYLEGDREAAKEYLKSYVETYLKEEIEAEALVRTSGVFLRFLFQASHENGKIINYSTIARETGTTHVTVKEYYQILEDTLVGFFLFPFHKSNRKRLARHPKFYFFDTGVQRALTKKLSLDLIPGTIEFGDQFETWVINETMRIASYLKKDFEFSYFRTERGAEVDLVIETPKNQLLGIEIKSSTNPNASDFRSGFKAIKEICPQIRPICVCRAPHARKQEGVEILPWKDYFALLQTI